MSTTPKWGLHYPQGTDIPDVPYWMNLLATDLDDVAKYTQGLLAARPAATTSGKLYLATDDTTGGKDGTLYRSDGTNWVALAGAQIPQCKVWNSVVQSIPNATDTALTFDSAEYNLGTPSSNMWAVGDPTKMYARMAGLHEINATFAFPAANQSLRSVWIRLNGTTIIKGAISSITGLTTNGTDLQVVAKARLAVGDYVQAIAHQVTGSSVNTLASASHFCTLSMERLSP